MEQDPLSARRVQQPRGALDASGRLAEAEAAYRKALELAPQRVGAHATASSLNLLAQGRGDEALAEALREPEEWHRLWALAIIHHAAGRRAESDAALQELIAKHQDDVGLPDRDGVRRARRDGPRLRSGSSGRTSSGIPAFPK